VGVQCALMPASQALHRWCFAYLIGGGLALGLLLHAGRNVGAGQWARPPTLVGIGAVRLIIRLSGDKALRKVNVYDTFIEGRRRASALLLLLAFSVCHAVASRIARPAACLMRAWR